ncbi:serine protease [Streptacidiphilus sp. P02-A3a]|uniref:trypsin-like serine peptidase n=1 Tax=Streptacidiphilus sp. P02-A3a TaxID=2704468 RepID=UPI0015F8532F|nr:trypsin-like peptidase domain-containing protein [Streptacidiphilus sp. P02-A3a]QMU68007.1 serine protease [Streptacidiphilus sp. P02-A3a]
MTLPSLTRRLRPVAVVACLLGAGAAATAAPSDAVPRLPRSTVFDGTPRVGALFDSPDGSLNGEFCTAAVVDSPGRDLVLTAAHCTVAPGSGKADSDLMFVPGYVSGRTPYGRWRVRRAVVDSRWSRDGDPDYDVAFLTTVPLDGTDRVQDAVGAEHVGFGRLPSRTRVVSVGYPWHTRRPVYCRNRLRRHGGSQLEFDCPGMPRGTSGSPLLTGVDATGSGPGTAVGVIGGYQAGGATDDISYSPYFGPGIAAVYRAATAQG